MSNSRETLQDLIKLGVLEPGTEIEMLSIRGTSVQAIITTNGKIQLSSGEVFQSPSAAARFLRNGISANGWKTWRLCSNAMQIGTLRSIYRQE